MTCSTPWPLPAAIHFLPTWPSCFALAHCASHLLTPSLAHSFPGSQIRSLTPSFARSASPCFALLRPSFAPRRTALLSFGGLRLPYSPRSSSPSSFILENYCEDETRGPGSTGNWAKLKSEMGNRVQLMQLKKTIQMPQTPRSISDVVATEKRMAEAVRPYIAQDIDAVVEGIGAWDFDLFLADELSGGQGLLLVGSVLFAHHDLLTLFKIHPTTLENFLSDISNAYIDDNTYHNALHGADVTQTLHYFIQTGGVGSYLTQEMLFTCIVAALIHDCGHPGVNNAFRTVTAHPSHRTPNPACCFHQPLCPFSLAPRCVVPYSAGAQACSGALVPAFAHQCLCPKRAHSVASLPRPAHLTHANGTPSAPPLVRRGPRPSHALLTPFSLASPALTLLRSQLSRRTTPSPLRTTTNRRWKTCTVPRRSASCRIAAVTSWAASPGPATTLCERRSSPW